MEGDGKLKTKRNFFVTVFTSASLLLIGGVAAFAQAPSDPQIAGIVQAANEIDIDMAKLVS